MRVRQPLPGLENLKGFADDIYKLIRANITFGSGTTDDSQNIKGRWVTEGTPVAPNTDFSVTHNLGVIPTGYLIMKQDKACSFYVGATPWTDRQIFLKASVASVTFTVFILS